MLLLLLLLLLLLCCCICLCLLSSLLPFTQPSIHLSIHRSTHTGIQFLSCCWAIPSPQRRYAGWETQACTLISSVQTPSAESLNNTSPLCPVMIDVDICCYVNTTLLKWSGSSSQWYNAYGVGLQECIVGEPALKTGLSSVPSLLLVVPSHWKGTFLNKQP